ncbi:hypothetical protein MRB53_039241 [Persea americana]|nr:hypothetical protein MRB53_039241 [Persea americana]
MNDSRAERLHGMYPTDQAGQPYRRPAIVLVVDPPPSESVGHAFHNALLCLQPVSPRGTQRADMAIVKAVRPCKMVITTPSRPRKGQGRRKKRDDFVIRFDKDDPSYVASATASQGAELLHSTSMKSKTFDFITPPPNTLTSGNRAELREIKRISSLKTWRAKAAASKQQACSPVATHTNAIESEASEERQEHVRPSTPHLLGAGSYDPFDSLPITMDRDALPLLHLYVNAFPGHGILRPLARRRLALDSQLIYMPRIMHTKTACLALLAYAASTHSTQSRSSAELVPHYLGQAMAAIGDAVRNEDREGSVGTFLAALLLTVVAVR